MNKSRVAACLASRVVRPRPEPLAPALRMSWSGPTTADGRPHGRGTLVEKCVRYEGHMRYGEREGLGVMQVHEGSDDDGDCSGMTSTLRVTWRHDEPHGRGIYTEPGGCSLHGCWSNGELRGLVHERYAEGWLRFCGVYRSSVRHGDGIELRADGGCLVGTWRHGELDGTCCAYLFPCARGGALVGEWREGRMHRATYVMLTPPLLPPTERASRASGTRHRQPLPPAVVHPAVHTLLGGVPLASLVDRRDPRAERFRPLTLGHQGRMAAAESGLGRADPHEASRVVVGASAIAGEGLLAARRLEGGELVAFFGGVRVLQPEERVESSAASFVGSLVDSSTAAPPSAAAGDAAEPHELEPPPAGVDPDWGVPTAEGWVWLPPDLRRSQQYAASLGHKANYGGYRANCTLSPFDHPVLGPVQAVRVLPEAPISAGVELTIDGAHLVGLPPECRPHWLRALLAERTEEGYYSHLKFTPQRQLASRRSPRGHRLHVQV